ncbi:MAG: tetratricopeptide repeat protein [Planctomycetota bacterium]
MSKPLELKPAAKAFSRNRKSPARALTRKVLRVVVRFKARLLTQLSLAFYMLVALGCSPKPDVKALGEALANASENSQSEETVEDPVVSEVDTAGSSAASSDAGNKTEANGEHKESSANSTSKVPTSDSSGGINFPDANASKNAAGNTSAAETSAETEPLPETVDELFQLASLEAEKLLDASGESPDGFEMQARVFWLQGKYRRAGECWEWALGVDPNYAYALHGLGKVAGKKAEFEEAASYHLRALEVLPDYPEAVYEAAAALTQLGRLDEAKQLLDARVTKSDQDVNAWLKLAQLEVARRDYASAQKGFEKVLELAPNQIDALQALAICHMRLGNREKAMEVQSKAKELLAKQRSSTKGDRIENDGVLKYGKQVAEILTTSANLYMAKKQYDAVERVLVLAGQLDKENHQCRTQLAGLYMGLMQAEPALRVCRELAELDPKNPIYLMNYGMMLFRANQRQESIATLKESLALQRSPQAFVALAEVLLAEQQKDEAETAMQQAMALDAGNAQLLQLYQQWFGK